MIIITGGIDLSAGSIVALVGVIVASLVRATPGSILGGRFIVVGLVAGLAVGLIAGLMTGSLIAKTGIAPFIATLGMMQIARGIALIYSGGRPIDRLSENFLTIGSNSVWFIPVPVIVWLGMAAISSIILKKTRLGKYLYAVGGSEQAANICGINISRVKIFVYCYAGAMAAVSAIVLTSRVSSGNPTAGISYELDAISAAVIGGTSLAGGIGSIFGTIIGALIMGVLNNGLTLLNVSPYLQTIVKGSIIIGAVVADAMRHKRSGGTSR